MGPLEVLTDTMGVDFGPYLQRVLHDVRMNWYTSFRSRHGPTDEERQSHN